ncbi:hypothetical protein Tco_0296832 [Tanacetum coccineum]
MKFLSESLMTKIKEQVKDQLPQILPKEVSNFAPLVIEKLIKESCDEVTLAKVYSQPHSTYEAASTLTEFELKKILIDRIRKDKDKDEDPSVGSDRGLKKRKTSKDAEPTTSLKNKDSMSSSSKGTESQPKPSGKSVQSEEPVFEVADSDMPQDQEGNPCDNDDEPRKNDASRRDWFKKPTPPQEPSDPNWHEGKTPQKGLTQKLLKGTRSNYAELEYDFEECYKALSEKLAWENPERGGVLTMTYMTSTTKTKAAQYDLPSIEDMVPNIWSPVKVAYDKYVLWGYLEEIEVRRANNVLYRFKEGDFLRLLINDIKDMLLLVVQKQLTNLSGDDVADFAIALRMFTRSLVIQKQVEDLQRGVESYQKQINVTKPDTTRPNLIKRHMYTPYKDPQGFIYVNDFKRNRLMCSDELYKFSNGTLTRLLSSLKDITKNINMEYLPKRRWSTLEKKRAHFMIKNINKLLKERRMMRSLEKFVGVQQVPEDKVPFKPQNALKDMILGKPVNVEGGIVSDSFGDMETNCQDGKLVKVFIVIKSCMPNELDDLTVTLKDLLGHCLNITLRNMVMVFPKDSVTGNASGVGRSGIISVTKEEISTRVGEATSMVLFYLLHFDDVKELRLVSKNG